MVELKIVKIEKFDEYVLEEGRKQHSLALGFYNMPKPKLGDVLIVPEEWLNTKSPDFVHSLYFEPLENNDNDEVKESDIVALHTKSKNYVIKRVYG